MDGLGRADRRERFAAVEAEAQTVTPLTALLTCRAPIVQNSLGWISASSRLPAARFDMLCMLAQDDAHGSLRTWSTTMAPPLRQRQPVSCGWFPSRLVGTEAACIATTTSRASYIAAFGRSEVQRVARPESDGGIRMAGCRATAPRPGSCSQIRV